MSDGPPLKIAKNRFLSTFLKYKGGKMKTTLTFCEECGCKLELSDGFCTGCGLFLDRSSEAKTSGEQIQPVGSPAAVAPIASAPTVVPVPQKPTEAPVEIKSNQAVSPPVQQQPDRSAPVQVAAPKSSSMSAVYALVALVAVGGTGAFFVLKGGSTKDSSKNVSAAISQKQGATGAANSESATQAPKITATGQMLVDAAVSGDREQFQALLHQLQTRIAKGTVDRKLARSLNDEALKSLKSGDYSAAIDTLKKASEADAADAEISNNLGYALRMAGDFKASESQLVGTIEKFPARQQAWSDLGETYSKLGKHSLAVAAFMAGHQVAKNPDKLLEKYMKLAESTEDEALKADLAEAAQKISEAK
jgi:Flp pilus assembly protein TadD